MIPNRIHDVRLSFSLPYGNHLFHFSFAATSIAGLVSWRAASLPQCRGQITSARRPHLTYTELDLIARSLEDTVAQAVASSTLKRQPLNVSAIRMT
ncbi:hypothetical protein SK128_025809 [Halocaridina rubra]|uniref:Uncharacterized protein n=1 Tax=Halocaridina rubra TaxID=373956 RepID=A0AAN8WR90_HALRR